MTWWSTFTTLCCRTYRASSCESKLLCTRLLALLNGIREVHLAWYKKLARYRSMHACTMLPRRGLILDISAQRPSYNALSVLFLSVGTLACASACARACAVHA
eukprot:2394094-Pleurochrysis_carterae.AAC.8